MSNSTLINGIGRYSGGPNVSLAVVNVVSGLRSVQCLPRLRWNLILVPNSYRLRLVSISCDPNFNFTIDGHNLTIIEVDGENHQPLVVDSLQIFAGTDVQKHIYMAITHAKQDNGTRLW